MPNNIWRVFFLHPKSHTSLQILLVLLKNTEGLIIPIDSKFYQGQYQNYHNTNSKTEKNKVLHGLKRTILNDAEVAEISRFKGIFNLDFICLRSNSFI